MSDYDDPIRFTGNPASPDSNKELIVTPKGIKVLAIMHMFVESKGNPDKLKKLMKEHLTTAKSTKDYALRRSTEEKIQSKNIEEETRSMRNKLRTEGFDYAVRLLRDEQREEEKGKGKGKGKKQKP